MVNATKAILARRAALAAAQTAMADSQRQTKLNMQNLATFFVAMGKAEAVDERLAKKTALLREQAAQSRDEQRCKAGAALREIHARGERIRDIARLAGIGEKRARELMRLAGARLASDSAVADAATHDAGGATAAEVCPPPPGAVGNGG